MPNTGFQEFKAATVIERDSHQKSDRECNNCGELGCWCWQCMAMYCHKAVMGQGEFYCAYTVLFFFCDDDTLDLDVGNFC